LKLNPSDSRKALVIGMLGLGVVGSGVATSLQRKAVLLENLLGRPLELRSILVRDPTKERPVRLPAGTLTSDPAVVLDDPDVNIIVELLGRVDPAHKYICRAIRNGKHVVTANKDVLALHGSAILGLALEHNVDLYFEASVGAGIPLVGSFRQALVANEIQSLHAIINGTTNYILTRMVREGLDFEVALKSAQRLGYAESDPRNDLDGEDAAYKLAILASLAFHFKVEPSDVYREGISSLKPADFRYAGEFGYAIKLLAVGKRDGNKVELRVHPVLINQDHLLAGVNDVFNAVRVQGDLMGEALFYGRGAGSKPSSSAVVADIVDAAHNINSGVSNRIPFGYRSQLKLRPIGEVVSRSYVRLWVADRPGVLAQIAHIFGNQTISIAACVQKETNSATQGAEIVILTHPAREDSLQGALSEVARLVSVHEVASHIRIEDFH